ncbi:MAG: beta-ketoacyl synthase N-terminal-like domain-containing protein [bacterium]
MEGREIWITGWGMNTPLGGGAKETWEAIRSGGRGIERHPQQEEWPLPENYLYYGVVEGFEEPPEVPPKLTSQRKFLCRGSVLGLHAVREAIAHAGLDMGSLPPERKALFIGSGDLTRASYLDFHQAMKSQAGPEWKKPEYDALNEAALHQVNPFFLLEGLTNNLFSYLSALYEIMGTNGSMSSLSSCGSQALECCERALRWGEADIGLVVGCGSWIDQYIRFELDGLGMLSRALSGADSYRPFDRRRDGFFPAEGAAVLVLEAAETARERDARPLGRVLGTGNFQEVSTSDHLAVPSKSIPRVCRSAMNGAEFPPEELAFILPHGSGTKKGDHFELRGLKDYLGEDGKQVPLAGWKSYTGHMGSASDVGEMILGLCALEEGVLPPTPGFEQSDREFADLNIAGAECRVGGKAFLSLSHGLGGQSSATLLSAP